MKIIQFSDSFLPVMDGVGNVVYQYALNLGQRGHESYVVAPQTDTGYRGNFPFEIVDYTGMPLPKLKSYKVGAPALDAHCHRRLAAINADNPAYEEPLAVSKGAAVFDHLQDKDFKTLFARADEAMYACKAEYYRTHGDRRRR